MSGPRPDASDKPWTASGLTAEERASASVHGYWHQRPSEARSLVVLVAEAIEAALADAPRPEQASPFSEADA